MVPIAIVLSGSSIPRRRYEEPWPGGMDGNGCRTFRKPIRECQLDFWRIVRVGQDHSQVGCQVLLSSMAIESWVGFIELAIGLHVHQARCFVPHQTGSNRNRVRAELGRCKEFGDRIEHEVRHGSAFPKCCSIGMENLLVPSAEVSQNVE